MEKNNQQSNKSPARRKPAKKKGARNSTKIFYTTLLSFILIFVIALTFFMSWLKGELEKHEASQSKYKQAEVFSTYFENPDWKEIYALADDDYAFDAEAYASYMTEKVAGQELNCIEISAGLTGNTKYAVRCGRERIATFTLGQVEPGVKYPTWELVDVEIFYNEYVTPVYDTTVIVPLGYTVMVDGTALDDSYVIRQESTKAEEYLPEGVHGYGWREMYIGSLSQPPQVQVLDIAGNPVTMSYDEATRTYSHPIEESKPLTETDPEHDTLLTATKTYCEYMIGKKGRADLKKYFDSETDIYHTIVTSDTWMQKFTGYDFSEAVIDNYYRYSDNLYSARVQLTLNVTRKNGTVKEYEVADTFFVEKKGEDQWLVIDKINLDAQERTKEARLTFMVDDQVLSSEMVSVSVSSLALPQVSIPEGKTTFMGWFTEQVDENGDITYDLVFAPSESNTVYLPEGNALEPITLKALFE